MIVKDHQQLLQIRVIDNNVLLQIEANFAETFS